jgi:hypothetical protein
LCTPSGVLSHEDKEALAKEAGYCIVKIDGVNVYAPLGTPQDKMSMQHVVFGGKQKTVKLGPIQSTTHPLFRRQEFIPVPCTRTFVSSDTGHAELPHQVLPDDLGMTKDGFVFPVSMSEEEKELRQKGMHVTGSVFTKHEPVYEIADGTPCFTFAVHKTPPGTAAGKSIIGGDVKMEYDEDETTGGPRVVRGPGAKKKHTATFESAASSKTTTSKTRKSSGGLIVKSLDFSGQRTSIAVSPRERALKVIRRARRTASWRVFHQLEHDPAVTGSWSSHLFYMSVLKSASAALRNSTIF